MSCGQTDGRTDVKKLMAMFRHFSNALNKSQLRVQFLFVCLFVEFETKYRMLDFLFVLF